jgi:uncharacterized membrane protein YfcA
VQASDLIEVIVFLLTGAASGLAAGMFGVGGGLIIVPVLHYALKLQGYDSAHLMHIAVATSLAVIVITSLSSTLAHQRKGAVLWPVFLIIAPGVMIGAWLGGHYAATLSNRLLTSVFALFEFAVAISLFLKNDRTSIQKQLNKTVTAVAGIVIGFVSAIIGIAGGTMTVPFLHWFNINMKNAVATSAAVGFPIALAGALSYIATGWEYVAIDKHGNQPLMLGFVQLTALGIIAVSSFLFAPLGAHIAHRISDSRLRISFAVLLVCLSMIMFFSE